MGETDAYRLISSSRCPETEKHASRTAFVISSPSALEAEPIMPNAAPSDIRTMRSYGVDRREGAASRTENHSFWFSRRIARIINHIDALP